MKKSKGPRRLSPEERIAAAKAAFQKTQSVKVTSNDVAVIQLFADRGIDPETVIPRVTVLTFSAWAAFGRHVKRGEAAIPLPVFEVGSRENKDTGETETFRFLKTSHVFHISQTEPDERPHRDAWSLTAEMEAALRRTIPPAPEETSEPEPMPVTISYGATVIHSTAPEETTAAADLRAAATARERYTSNGRRTPGDAPLFSNLTA